MKTLVAILLIASFLQATVLPVNLVLVVLICRAYLKPKMSNLNLAFIFGLLISLLFLSPLGWNSIIYLVLVEATQLLSKSPLSRHPFLIIPLTFILLMVEMVVSPLFTHQSAFFSQIVIESILSLPIFYLVKIWEERFIVTKEIKLRI